MANDMRIRPYTYESAASFCYRVVYSALSRWCLISAYTDNGKGVSKRYQTLCLNELLDKYTKLFPIDGAFTSEDESASVFIRSIYEELGFFASAGNGYNRIRQNPLIVDLSGLHLLIGYHPASKSTGIGLQVDGSYNAIPWKDYIGRNDIEIKDYLDANFSLVRFEAREFERDSLQFFNPKSNKTPSNSWQKSITTSRTVARCSEQGPYYCVIELDGELLFSEELIAKTDASIEAFEYRRLYFALKKYYGYPVCANITHLDEDYSELTVHAHLPNREYYLLLLLCWPKEVFNNKYSFIIDNNQLQAAKELLSNIGIDVK